MNKKFISLMLAAPLFMGVGLTSCSSEEPLQPAEQLTAQKKVVKVTMTAELPEGTRASLNPDGFKLKFAWHKDDVVKAFNAADGEYVGELTVSKVLSNPQKCEFAGTVNVPASGNVDLKFYYVASHEIKLGYDDEKDMIVANDMTLTFAEQDGTENFSDNDILIAQQSYENLTGDLGTLKFERNLTYSHFVLKYNGEILDVNGKEIIISAAEGTLYNSTSLNFQNAAYDPQEGNIVVKPTAAENGEFFATFIPSENVSLQFSVKMDDGDFSGKRLKSLKVDKYISEDTAGSPVVVEMRADDGRDDVHHFRMTYVANYENANPTVLNWSWDNKGFSNDFTVKNYDIFTRDDFEIVRWNTEADGSGKDYKPGDTFTVNWNEGDEVAIGTLYAIWAEKTYTWAINWTVEGEIVQTKTVNGEKSPFTLTEEYAFPADPTREGYVFTGWEYNGVKVNGPSNVTLTKPGGNVEIKATWKKGDSNGNIIAPDAPGSDY